VGQKKRSPKGDHENFSETANGVIENTGRAAKAARWAIQISMKNANLSKRPPIQMAKAIPIPANGKSNKLDR
jgi:hypothetical protein